MDAAQIARENINFWRVIERVLVSGLRSAALQAPRAGMVMRGSGPNLAPELEVPSRTLVFPILINRSFFHSVSFSSINGEKTGSVLGENQQVNKLKPKSRCSRSTKKGGITGS